MIFSYLRSLLKTLIFVFFVYLISLRQLLKRHQIMQALMASLIFLLLV